MDSKTRKTVLVTGFGPFGKHNVNASWKAVEELLELCADSEELRDVELIAKEIPVSYDHVSSCIPMLWEQHDPTVVLHLGVSHKANCLTVEHLAHNSGYVKPDIHKKCPDETDVVPVVLETRIDVKEVCDVVNKNSSKTECKACVSHDPGRYLCEYIFYKSLSVKPSRTLFVHVPDFNVYSSKQTARGLYDILCYLIRNVKD